MEFLEIGGLRKSYGQNAVVHNFDLSVKRGEFISFLGPSGCGKTTTLRMVAGFESPTAGLISMDGKEVTQLRPNQRNVGMVFQAYALFPNMTVADNVAFGLKVAKRPAAEIGPRVKEMLELIKLPHLADPLSLPAVGRPRCSSASPRFPAPSAIKPKVLLLDEPLSALDAKIRVSLRSEIKTLQRELGITTIFVTHDQEEALSMSDRVVVMNEGNAEQVGTPFDIYNYPRTRFVASFVGTLNILRGKVIDAGMQKLMIDDQEIIATRGVSDARNGEIRSVALRPEAVTLAGSPEGRWTATACRARSRM